MHFAKKLGRPATLADLDDLPTTWRGEIIDGDLYAFPRPSANHANIEGLAIADLKNPFQRGRGGPGGWWILSEPGIELPRAPELSPDLAGWRRERMPNLPGPKVAITVVPDWACEILSKGTRSYDLVKKRRFYAEVGVAWLWYIDPREQTLTVSQLVEGKWLELGVYGGDDRVRAAPFDAIELDLAEWWEGSSEEEEE